MASVHPFRALRYHARYAAEMDRLTVPPYDVIGHDERERYLRAHPKNIIRLILPQDQAPATTKVYRAPAALLRQWRAEGTLELDDKAAFYPYRQTYLGPDGEQSSRLGFLGALSLARPGEEGGALPHERTMPGPRQDRTRLMTACRANLSPIFLIHNDPGAKVGPPLAQATQEAPLFDFLDEKGTRHQLWRMTEASKLRQLQEGMKDDWLLIADGHHRYESAQNVMGALPKDKGAQYILGFFCRLQDSGFKIFPIHRIVRAEGMPEAAQIGSALRSRWTLRKVPEPTTPERTLSLLRQEGNGTLGVLLKGEAPSFIRLADSRAQGGDFGQELDTQRLQREVLCGVLRLSQESMAEGAVHYTPDAHQAFTQVRSGEAVAAFLLNPLQVETVVELARAGVRLPQKSTYFYPKVLTGLVLRPF